uniref:Carboxypeptidase activation peptide domain-containing protein n=1 Tax=Cacopsylla melanoneura TaxID=428564 RepID=A0A8D8ZAB8_9HEMI
MSRSWFLILFTVFLTVHIVFAEPSKRSKHRGYQVSEDTQSKPLLHSEPATNGTGVNGVTDNSGRIIVPTDYRVKYDGAQVYRVFVANSKGRKRVNDLADKGVVEKWRSNTTSVDIMVKADKLTAVKQYLEKAKLTYEVVLDDVQRAIDEENPEISEEELALLTGRKGKIFTSMFFFPR